MSALFEIGEVINSEDSGLRLQITRISQDELDNVMVYGVIVKNSDTTSYLGKAFPLGTNLRFKRVRDDMVWVIFPDDVAATLPWYVLSVHDGRKRFEHYR